MTNPRRFRGAGFAVTGVLATLLAASLAAALVLLPASTASASSSAAAPATAPGPEPTANITVPPPGGNVLLVFAYFDGNDRLVGQFWRGCNQPSGGWGTRQGRFVLYTPPCGP